MTLISFIIEETRVRSHFNAEYGLHLPEDLCLCIGNSPTRWEVVPWEGSSLEVLPSIDADLIADVSVPSSWSMLRSAFIYLFVKRLENGLVSRNRRLGRRACDILGRPSSLVTYRVVEYQKLLIEILVIELQAETKQCSACCSR